MIIAAAGDETVESVTVISNSSSNISDGLWHSVRVRKSGSRVLLLIDEHPSAEANADTAWSRINQADSDLFIGGIPSQSHDIDSSAIIVL